MADQNKDQSKSLTGSTESGSTGQFRSASTQSTLGDDMRTGKGVNENAAGMAASARQYADDMTSRAKDKGRSMFAQQKDSALGQVNSVAGAIRNTAQNLQGEGQDQTARYVTMIADQLESLGGRLRNKDLDTLVRDAESMARRSPGAFLAGSVAVGFLLSRFLKSSSRRSADAYDEEWDEQDLRTADAGEAAAYGGSTTTSVASPLGADGTPGTATGTTTTGASPGLTGSNIGGSRP